MARCRHQQNQGNRSLQRALVLLILSLATAHALPSLNVDNPPLRLPGGGSVPVAGKPVRQNSIEIASPSNVPRDQVQKVAAVGEDGNMPKKLAQKEVAMEEPGGGSDVVADAASQGMSVGQMVAAALVVVTAGSFYQVRYLSGPGGSKGVERDGNYLAGLAVACLALVGNAMVGAFRKLLSQHNVGSAQQVGFAALIQGIFAIAYCFQSGDLKLGTPSEMVDALPPKVFWYAAIAGSVLNSVVKTLETKAFAESDISLCAPFLAFDPVMQFVVGVAVMPIACYMAGFGCEEAKSSYPPYHVLSVMCIATGAFLLGQGAAGSGKKATTGQVASKLFLGLPRGSWYILLNCVIYGFTSRLDKVAIKSAGKTLYYAYGRLLMAATTLGGSVASGGMTRREISKFTTPQVMTLIGAICVSDAVYMLSLYQAFAWISPVYVTAIKRGGGILLSSLLGVVLFSESMAGRFGPILTICCGVTFLCL